MIDSAVSLQPRFISGAVAKEKHMHTIKQTVGQLIAEDTSKSVDAVDQAAASLATLCASIVEVSKASNLPVGSAQKALDNVGKSLGSVIASRADVAAATREMTAIQRKSNLREVGFGCPGGFPEGNLSEPVVAEKAD